MVKVMNLHVEEVVVQVSRANSSKSGNTGEKGMTRPIIE